MKEWIYTSEQAKAIKNGDIDLRNKFYFDNYERIKIFAKSFLSRERISSKSVLCSLEDLLQGLCSIGRTKTKKRTRWNGQVKIK